MRAVLVDQLPGAIVLIREERIVDGENRVVASGGNVQHIVEEIEREAGGADH